MAVDSLIESSHFMPAETRGALAGALALADISEVRAAAVLFLLDPASTIRRTVAAALGRVASSLGPTDVRRLIAMRNWRPENERAKVDEIIHKARAAGVHCAQWEAGSIETTLATCLDGSMAQGFLLISPAGRKKRISSLLTKAGIDGAWSGEPETRRRAEATLPGINVPTLGVSRSYLDRTVAHHLVLTVEKGRRHRSVYSRSPRRPAVPTGNPSE